MRCNAEVFVTMNALLFSTVLQALRREKIPYDTRQVPTGLSNRGGNMAGNLGECADFNVLFYVYVPKKLKEQAQEAIANAQHEFSLQRY